MLLWICAEFVQSLQVETLGTYPLLQFNGDVVGVPMV